MRICVINEFFYPDNTGGTGAVLSDLSRHLLKNYPDVQIDVVTSRNLYRSNQPLPHLEDWCGVCIHRLQTPRSNTPSLPGRLFANVAFSFAALFRMLRLGKFDVVLVGTAPPTTPMAAQIYKKLTKTPFVYITYDLEPDRAIVLGIVPKSNWAVKQIAKVQYRWLYSASKVVVLGRCMREYINKNYRLKLDDIAVIPIGFDTEKVRSLNKQTRFRREHEITGFVALYAGNFGRYHNFDTLLDAASELRDTDKNIQFVLVGDGAQGANIAKRVAAEKLHNVHVYPFVPEEEFEDLIASADVSIVTLEQGMEGLCVPSKLYSTMAAGRAIIAIIDAHSEVARVVEEANCGVNLEPGDSAGLVHALRRLSSDPAEVERMGRNARCTLEAEYSTARIAHQYYQVFCEITNTAPEKIGVELRSESWAHHAAANSSYSSDVESDIDVEKVPSS